MTVAELIEKYERKVADYELMYDMAAGRREWETAASAQATVTVYELVIADLKKVVKDA